MDLLKQRKRTDNALQLVEAPEIELDKLEMPHIRELGERRKETRVERA